MNPTRLVPQPQRRMNRAGADNERLPLPAGEGRGEGERGALVAARDTKHSLPLRVNFP